MPARPPGFRVALYYAPSPHDTLAIAGAAWLGRDAETGARVAQPAIPGIDSVTAEARIYGFHATLKPPMRLTTDWATFLGDVESLATRLAPFDLPPLRVAELGGFLAVVEAGPSPALRALADAAVEGVDRHRLPPDTAELAKRRRIPLSVTEDAMLQRWGYPYVFDTWRFHMTLSRRLTDEELAVFHPAAAAHFAGALAAPRRVTELCVFTQAASADGPAPFLIAERFPLRDGRPPSP
ncbi:MAG TPA: DUF1045 domain-containing protein [Acetobacteraceae bacterium]|nr:DUF1045 domain-containing protein [Acetobacteraceae bacterium]